MTPGTGDLSLARTAEGVAFWIHVTPRSRRPHLGGTRGDALRVAVIEPPVEGEATAACVRALAKALGVARSAVEIDPGSRSRRKRVRIEGDGDTLADRLAELAAAD